MSDQDSNSKQTGHTPPPHLKLPVWYQEESDVYTHHIRDQNKGMIVCSFGQDSSGEAEEKARYFVGAVNSHATLAEENAQLRKALELIAAQVELVPFAKRNTTEDIVFGRAKAALKLKLARRFKLFGSPDMGESTR